VREDHLKGLPALYVYPEGVRRWVRANMVASVDGLAEAGGVSAGLSSPADERLFHLLRGLADVVLVGAGTVRAEGYGPARVSPEYAQARAAAGQQPAAAIAVVSASLDLDFDSPLYTDATTPTITVTVEDARPDRLARARAAGEVALAGRSGRVDLAAAIDVLADSGRGRVLCEGGPTVLAAIAAADALDELCLTISPQLRAGAGLRMLVGPAFAEPIGLDLGSLLTDDGFVFARYLVKSTSTHSQ